MLWIKASCIGKSLVDEYQIQILSPCPITTGGKAQQIVLKKLCNSMSWPVENILGVIPHKGLIKLFVSVINSPCLATQTSKAKFDLSRETTLAIKCA